MLGLHRQVGDDMSHRVHDDPLQIPAGPIASVNLGADLEPGYLTHRLHFLTRGT